MKAVTIRVNDVEGVGGFVLPGDRVDVVLTRQIDKGSATTEVVLQNARVLAIDQIADERAAKPSVAKSVTLEVDTVEAQKVWLAASVGTLSLMLRKAGETAEVKTRKITLNDLGSNDAGRNRQGRDHHRGGDARVGEAGIQRAGRGQRGLGTRPSGTVPLASGGADRDIGDGGECREQQQTNTPLASRGGVQDRSGAARRVAARSRDRRSPIALAAALLLHGRRGAARRRARPASAAASAPPW